MPSAISSSRRHSGGRRCLALIASVGLAAMTAGALRATATAVPAPLTASPALLVGLRERAPDQEVASLHARLGSRVVRRLPQIGVDVVQPAAQPGPSGPAIDTSGLLASLAARYAASPLVRYVELDAPVFIFTARSATSAAPIQPDASTRHRFEAAGFSPFSPTNLRLRARPNDPSFDSQWMHATIHSEIAWDASHADGMVIAVIDTGVDCNHPDLQAACVAGVDIVNQDDDPSDDQGHGTIEAGVAAAVVNNNTGVAGVAWGAKIMPVKAMRANGAGTNGEITAGILWAADHGARIINLSLGGTTASQAMADAVVYASGKGALLAAAMGNSGDSAVHYPAAYAGVVGVAATTRGDSHASFSVTGDHCDLAAPGAEILTTRMGGGYYRYDGTSEATAVVSGLAALLAAQKPGRSPADIERIMEETAVDLGPSGFDPYFGHGRIDAGAALAKEAVLPTPAPPTPTAAPPAAICQRRTLRLWGFPDTVGVAGPGRACRGCDGVFSAGDRLAGAACPLGPLTVQVADAADPSRVYWEGQVPRASPSAIDVQAYVTLCQPPPYLVTLRSIATTCYRLCPTARAQVVLTQADFDRQSMAGPGSGEGRLAELRWFFWQCQP